MISSRYPFPPTASWNEVSLYGGDIEKIFTAD